MPIVICVIVSGILTRPEDEITLDVIKKLPEMAFTNITGGEPFIRKDIPEIVRELYKKVGQNRNFNKMGILRIVS